MNSRDANEFAASILKPHFDAVRDVFASFRPEPSIKLDRLVRVKLLVDPEIHDSVRHFAACRDDGQHILLAPEAADLPVDTLVAILSHEFGHAADFSYPGAWRLEQRYKPATWKPIAGRHAGAKMRVWQDRTVDQVEWTADAICFTILGKQIGYCGPCVLQCFSGGRPRPKGLR